MGPKIIVLVHLQSLALLTHILGHGVSHFGWIIDSVRLPGHFETLQLFRAQLIGVDRMRQILNVKRPLLDRRIDKLPHRRA
jgi:hypothetical protein